MIRRGTVGAVRLRVLSMWVVLAGCQASVAVAPPAPAPPRPAASIASVSASTSASTIAAASMSVSAEPVAAKSSSVEELVTLAPKVPVCTPQQALPFLVRKNYIPVSLKKKEFQKSLEWRTKQYGYVKGFGDKAWNASKPKDHAVSITLFGLPVTVHEKIVPALRCAEQEIKNSCASTPYVPATLSGLRSKNTYHGGEVTNHLYGIAVDLDPLLNSCCHCTKKWQKSPLCAKKDVEIWERMAMPKCWVDAFEKYGFYWLGHDVLQDTMHFEFLGDPELVMQLPGGGAVSTSVP